MENYINVKCALKKGVALVLVIISFLLVIRPLGDLSYTECAVIGAMLDTSVRDVQSMVGFITVVLYAVFICAVISVAINKMAGSAVYMVIMFILAIVDAVIMMTTYFELQDYREYYNAAKSVASMLGISSSGSLIELARNILISAVCSAVAFYADINIGQNERVFAGNWSESYTNTEHSSRKEKIRCPKCGTLNEPGSKFCGQCSAMLENPISPSKPAKRFCPGCGAEVTPGANFCGNCARKLDVDIVDPTSVIHNEKKCIRCGKTVYGESLYCSACESAKSKLSGTLKKPNSDDL